MLTKIINIRLHKQSKIFATMALSDKPYAIKLYFPHLQISATTFCQVLRFKPQNFIFLEVLRF